MVEYLKYAAVMLSIVALVKLSLVRRAASVVRAIALRIGILAVATVALATTTLAAYEVVSVTPAYASGDTTSIAQTGLGSSCIFAVEGEESTTSTVAASTSSPKVVHFKCYHDGSHAFPRSIPASGSNPGLLLVRASGDGVTWLAPGIATGTTVTRLLSWTVAFDQDGYVEGFMELGGSSARNVFAGQNTSYARWMQWTNATGGSTGLPAGSTHSAMNINGSPHAGVWPLSTCNYNSRVAWSAFGGTWPPCHSSTHGRFSYEVNPCDSLSTVWDPSGAVELLTGDTLSMTVDLGSGDEVTDGTWTGGFQRWNQLALSYRWGPSDAYRNLIVPVAEDLAPLVPEPDEFTVEFEAPRMVSSALFELRCSWNGEDFYYSVTGGSVGDPDRPVPRACLALVVDWPDEPTEGAFGLAFDYGWQFGYRLPADAPGNVTALVLRAQQTDVEAYEADPWATLTTAGAVTSYPVTPGSTRIGRFATDNDYSPGSFSIVCTDSEGSVTLSATRHPVPGEDDEDAARLADCTREAGPMSLTNPLTWLRGGFAIAGCWVRVMVVPDPENLEASWEELHAQAEEAVPIAWVLAAYEVVEDASAGASGAVSANRDDCLTVVPDGGDMIDSSAGEVCFATMAGAGGWLTTARPWLGVAVWVFWALSMYGLMFRKPSSEPEQLTLF